jgi:hypothetical protein
MGYPPPAGIGGGYPVEYSPHPVVVADRPYPSDGYRPGPSPAVGAEAGIEQAGPGGWGRRPVTDDADEPAGGHEEDAPDGLEPDDADGPAGGYEEDAPDGLEPDEFDSSLVPTLPG